MIFDCRLHSYNKSFNPPVHGIQLKQSRLDKGLDEQLVTETGLI